MYGLWTEHYRTAYPSTLYVTLKGIPNEVSEQTGNHFGPSFIQPTGRSMIPTLGEVGTLTLEQLLHKQQGAKRYSTNNSLIGKCTAEVFTISMIFIYIQLFNYKPLPSFEARVLLQKGGGGRIFGVSTVYNMIVTCSVSVLYVVYQALQ